MRKIAMIMLFVFGCSLLGINQNIPKWTIAQKGEGIWSLLRRNGLDPAKNILAFKQLNQSLLNNKNDLIVGEKYFLPGGPNRSQPEQKTNKPNTERLGKIIKSSSDDVLAPVIQNKPELKTDLGIEEGDLGVSLVNSDIKSLIPGTSSNVVIMLLNGTGSPKEFQLKINVPKSWSLLTDYASVMVAKRSKKIKVLSFYVKKSTGVGMDTINVEVYNKVDSKIIGTLDIPVSVMPRYEIELETLASPEYVFAGDSLNVNFRLRNLSNIAVDIHTTTVNQQYVENNDLHLEANAFVYVRVPVATPEDISIHTRKSVSYTAAIAQKPEISLTNSYGFDIIPSNRMKFDAFDRIPIRISGLGVSAMKQGVRRFGYMFDISGKGMISPAKKRLLEFRIRKPDEEGNPLFGLNEEFYGKYSSKVLSIVVGDHNYRLSDLTESSRYGRGAGLETKFKKIMFGGYLNYPKYYPEVRMVYSAYGSYYPSKNFRFNVGYLNKALITNQEVQLFTVSSTANLFKWARLDAEYAMGQNDDKSTMAYKASLKMGGAKLRTYFNYTKADPDFPGYISNSKYLSAGISSSIVKNSNISLSYELNHLNSALDTLYSNAPLSTNLSFSTMFRIKKKHHLGLAVYQRKREDRFEPKLFNYEEYSARISVKNKIGKFELTTYGEMGKINNLLTKREGEITTIYKSYLSMFYHFNENFSVEMFANYKGGEYYQSQDLTSIYYGASIDALIWNKLNMKIEYQSNYEVEDYYRDRSLLSSRIHFKMNNKHDFGLSANYNLVKNSLESKELNVIFNYNYTINVPVAKKKNIGSLKGRVIGKGIKSVEGIVFTLAGNIALTNSEGYFEFPTIKTGTYYLLMDDSNTGLNTIAETPGPYRIEILPGSLNHFEIVLTKSARITGKIIVQQDENTNSKGYVPVKEKLGNQIIEVSKGTEVYRVLSSKDGFFNFEDLRTGTWQLKVYENGIPAGYQLITKQFELELTSGQVKVVEVFIKKESRKIKFQRKLISK